ncbi:MAG TPA: hypothetical protein VGG85_18935 [Terracidiphilus sp.]
MGEPRVGWPTELLPLVAAIWLGTAVSHALASSSAACVKVGIEAEVSAGREWSAPLGQGWIFRVMPIQPARAGYSGWDLVVDRDPGAGYPDALLLATMPYDSINEREIGTTYGLRSQDAIGWNPRSFRFLVDPAAFHESQHLFQLIAVDGIASTASRKPDPSSTVKAQAMARLIKLQKRAAGGEFRILDAHLVPGTSDPASYAQGWALAFSRVPHQVDSSTGGSGPLGSINWMRFSLTLWLPARWNVAGGLHTLPSACPD